MLRQKVKFLLAAYTLSASTLYAQEPAPPPDLKLPPVPTIPELVPPTVLTPPMPATAKVLPVAAQPMESPRIGTPLELPKEPAPLTPPTPPTLTSMPVTTSTPVVTGTLPFEEKPKGDDGVQFKFKPGDEHLLQMETNNGLFKFFVGGRLQIDATWMRASNAVQTPPPSGIGDTRDAVNFRRARFDFGGTFYKNIDFLMEWDFINTVNAERNGAPLPINTPVPTDMWVTFKNIPYIGNVRVGNQKPPIGFEHLTSSRYLNFLERSLAFDAFVENQNNGFEPGIMAFNTFVDQRLYAALGVFKHTRSIFGWNVGDGEYDLSGRVTALPLWLNDGEQLIHVGVGGSVRGMDDGQDRMRARLLVRDGPAVLHNIVAEARMFGDTHAVVAPEFVAVWGPWTFQAEYYGNWITNAIAPVDGPAAQRVNNGTVYFNGGYAEVLYFLTGEHRTYDRGRAAFTRVTPKSNFQGFSADGASCMACEGHGWGAWQVGVRYSWVDLDNKNIRGGSAQDMTVGLNWFLNPYMKLQWNYTMLYRNAFDPRFDGFVHGLGTRIAFDF